MVHKLHQCIHCTIIAYGYGHALQPLTDRDVLQDHAPPHFHIITLGNERVTVVIETVAILAGSADERDHTEAISWAKANRATLRRLWRQYSE
jgi:hypothetical protein